MRKTKIVCTLGPAVDDFKVLTKLCTSGMDVARFNFSHGDYAQQQKRIEELEEELSKTKFDLFEKQKEALSLNNEKAALQEEIDNVNKKMDGILNVIQGNKE